MVQKSDLRARRICPSTPHLAVSASIQQRRRE